MKDHEVDRRIEESLTWEADQATGRHPPVRLAIRRLAVRTEMSAAAPVDAAPSEPRPVPAPRLATNIAALASVLVAAVLGVSYLLGPGNLLGVVGPLHVSERHGYAWRLPDQSWSVTEFPGEWEVGAFLDVESPGSDYFETSELPPRKVLVYAWLASQAIPASMSFDGWLYLQDGVTAASASCFQLQGAYEQVQVANETARFGVYYCPNFLDSGVGWATVQVLFAHEGRGYAIYFWPEQEPDTPPMEQVRSAALRWLSQFDFTDSSQSP